MLVIKKFLNENKSLQILNYFYYYLLFKNNNTKKFYRFYYKNYIKHFIKNLLIKLIFLENFKKKKLSFKLKKNNNIIFYILNIFLTNSNLFVNISNNFGNINYYISSGLLKYKGSEKTNKYSILSVIQKTILANYNIVKNKSVVVHFKGNNNNVYNLVLKYLKKNFNIKAIKYYNLLPHNGCRPKKYKRI